MNEIQELRLHAKALVRAIEQDRKFFASVAHYAERLNWIVAAGVGELTQLELRVLTERIEQFFKQWRSLGHGPYTPPRQAADADPMVQAINEIVWYMVALDEADFQQLKQREVESMLMGDATDEAGDLARDPVLICERICDRFHLVTRQLRCCHNGRGTLDVKDEYDAQDLLHALLKLFFDDIRPEEWTPSYAGKSSRIDFLLKDEQIVIEVKMTRDGLGDKEVGTQLIDDIARYGKHQSCKRLICFVYDPEGKIANPAGLESDLSRVVDGLAVEVCVTPKGY